MWLIPKCARERINRSRIRVRRDVLRSTFDSLESRTLLATLNITTGALVYDGTGTTVNNLTISTTGLRGRYTFTDLGETITLGAGATSAGWIGSGTNTVSGTDSSVNSILVDTKGGSDTVNVQSVDAPTIVTASNLVADVDTVRIGNPIRGVQAISGDVMVTNLFGKTALTIDDAANVVGKTATLLTTSSGSTIAGLAPSAITFHAASLNALAINSGDGGDTLTVDFSGGNPIPAGATGLSYLAGPAAGVDKNTLVLEGGSFNNETYNATANGAGTILLDASKLSFTGLRPIVDTVQAAGYTFNAPAVASTINVVNGATAGQVEINSGDPTPTFEKVDFADKALVLVNTAASVAETLNVKVTGPATGQVALALGTGSGKTTVNLQATPTSIGTTLQLGSGATTVNVTALGIGASGGSLTITGGTGTDTLNIDAGGLVASATSGATANSAILAIGTLPPISVLAFASPGVAANLDKINVTNAAELPLLPVAAPLAPIEGNQLENVLVATFTDRNHAVPGNFTATIAWGDGKTSPGTIVADPTTPGLFNVLGTHVYADETINLPPNTITVTVSDLGTSEVDRVGQIAGAVGVDVTITDNGGSKAVAGIVTKTDIVKFGAVAGVGVDPNLLNPWDVAESTTGPFWITDNKAGVATSYDVTGTNLGVIVIPPPPPAPPGTKSTPTGIAFNDTPGFVVAGNPAEFLFDTQDGTIAAWNTGPSATIEVDHSVAGAVYTGLALAQNGSDTFLYAANFHDNKIEVYDKTFALVGSFTDPSAPAGYAPFGIRNIGGNLFVTFAKQDGAKHDAATGAGLGLVDVFTPSGAVVKKLVSNGGLLNAPYGLALASPAFGPLANDLLVGNQGDGTINAYNPTTGVFLGTYSDLSGAPVIVAGLRGLIFGNAGSGGDRDTLYAVSSPTGPADGLFSGLTYGPDLAVVADAALTATAVNVPNPGALPINENAAFNGDVATFVDANSLAKASDFSISINWGDGTVASIGSAKQEADGTFRVSGSHTYTSNGSFTITTAIHDVGGSDAKVTSTAAIQDLALTAMGVNVPNPSTLPAVENQSFTAEVATFTDADGRAKAGDFTTSINWGDGSLASAGTVRLDNKGVFHVSGTHAYLSNGGFTVTTNILDIAGSTKGGSKATATSTATISDLPLSATGVSVPNSGTLPTVENQSLTAEVATFTDVDGRAKAGDFTSTIDWGDGTLASGGSIRLDVNGVFHVSGTHTYLSYGAFTVTTNILDTVGGPSGGSKATATSTATISDLPLAALGVNIPNPGTLPTVENQSLTAEVAVFTDADGRAKAGDFTATVDWGDGTLPSGGTIRLDVNGVFHVTGTHTYLTYGAFTVTTGILDTVGGPSGGSKAIATSTAAITDLPLSAAFVTVPNPGTLPISMNQAFSGEVAVFTDTDGRAKTGDFVATINWGDGTLPTGGTIRLDTSGVFHVSGTHTYLLNGLYTVNTSIRDILGGPIGGSLALTTGPALISDPILGGLVAFALPTPGNAPLIESKAQFSGDVAVFLDSDPNGKAAEFSAAINWGDGSFTTDGKVSEDATRTFHVSGSHLYLEEGTFAVTITILDTGAIAPVVVIGTATVLDAALTIKPVNITATEGVPFMAKVATFTDANLNATLGDFAPTVVVGGFVKGAIIAWGDGGTSLGVVTQPNGPGTDFFVTGTYTYAEESPKSAPFTVTVLVLDAGGRSVITDPGTATVGDASLAGTAGGAVAATEGTATGAVPVATFTDSDPMGMLADYTATVDWGDGGSSKGTVAGPDGKGAFTVTGNHTYAHDGKFSVKTTITDVGTAATTATTTATVADAKMAPFPTPPIIAVAGVRFVDELAAAFSDANASSSVGEFTATIDWGDDPAGFESAASIVRESNGIFYDVYGSHRYVLPGTYKTTVTILDAKTYASELVIDPQVIVNGAPILATGTSVLAVEGIQAQQRVVSTFTDTALKPNINDYTTTVDWGDATGVDKTAIVVANGDGSFSVVGSHKYAEEGNFPVKVTIMGKSVTATATGEADVADAPITVSVAAQNLTEGTPFNGVVGTFTDNNPAGTVSDFTANILWDDGNTTVGTITQPGGVGTAFKVSAANIFDEGTYAVGVLVNDVGGSTGSATGKFTVADATLNGLGSIPINAVEGRPQIDVVVASFHDNNPATDASDFSAQITWGDTGSQFAARVVKTSFGDFDVLGTHTYADETGATPYNIAVRVSDDGGIVVNLTNTAAVADAPLDAKGAPSIPAVVNVDTGMVQVATFNDENLVAPLTDFVPFLLLAGLNRGALIDWGDGTPRTPGTIDQPGGTGTSYRIQDHHSYAAPGDYQIKVEIADIGGSRTFALSEAIVTAAPPRTLSAAPGLPITAKEGQLQKGLTVGFFSANPGGPASDFTASIDWGDGSPNSIGVVTPFLLNTFFVSGDHTYLETGASPYPIKFTVFDKMGNRVFATNTATVAEAALGAATILPFTAVEGTPLNLIPVATFIDTNPLAPASDFTATLDWGQGMSNCIVVRTGDVAAGSTFVVLGSFTYTTPANYTVQVNVTDIDGARTNATQIGAATVADAPLIVATPGPIFTVVNKALPANTHLATFTDGNRFAQAGDFRVTVEWGDGGKDVVSAVALGNGVFSVMAGHLYQTLNDYKITVTVVDTNNAGNASSTITSAEGDIDAAVVGGIGGDSLPAGGKTKGKTAKKKSSTTNDGETVPGTSHGTKKTKKPKTVHPKKTIKQVHAKASADPLAVHDAALANVAKRTRPRG